MHEQQVLAALAATLPGAPPVDELVVLRTLRKRRSLLYFVSRRDGSTPRWVVKRPDPDRPQHDIRPPADARTQFASVVRLHDHLAAHGTRISSPRPVGLLPDVESLAMEYVSGQSLVELIRPRSVLQPGPLLAGMADAAEALLLMHRLAPRPAEAVDVAAVWSSTAEEVHRLLDAPPLSHGSRWSLPGAAPGSWVQPQEVLAHGDWAPENVMLDGESVICIDAELDEHRWAEQDVARFLVMLSDAPLFVTMTSAPPVMRIRRRAASAFITGYYGDRGVSPLLQPVLVNALAARWAMRDQDVVWRRPPGARSRRLLLRRHFTSLLDEATAVGWPECLLRDPGALTSP